MQSVNQLSYDLLRDIYQSERSSHTIHLIRSSASQSHAGVLARRLGSCCTVHGLQKRDWLGRPGCRAMC